LIICSQSKEKKYLYLRDENGMTPLIMAARYGYPETVRLMLEDGADINAKTHSGMDAVSWAFKNRHHNVLEVLGEYYPD